MNNQEIESKLIDQLKHLLASIPWLGDVDVSDADRASALGYDWKVNVPLGNGNKAILLVEGKAFPRPSQFPAVNQRSSFHGDRHSTEIPVLAAPRISPRMAELCDQHGWGWFDLAGNCKISAPNLLHIERSGNAPVQVNDPAEANLSTTESARVVRALLTDEDPSRKWTQRSLREACTPNVSLGLVNKVVRYLKDQAYLTDAESGRGFKMHDPLGLLKEWSQHYRFDQHLRHDYFTLLKPSAVYKRLSESLSKKEAQYALSVFSAAAEQAAHVRGELRLWLYIEGRILELFEEIAEVKSVTSGANIVVLIPQDTGVFSGKQSSPSLQIACTHPVQTYIDLKKAGGRGEEAAEALLEQKIKPVWKEANLVW